MDQSFDIQSYMTQGVERVVGDIVKATFRNPLRKRLYGQIRSGQPRGFQKTQEGGERG